MVLPLAKYSRPAKSQALIEPANGHIGVILIFISAASGCSLFPFHAPA
jgi:hypothetical protein